jgi:hypothetical protein
MSILDTSHKGFQVTRKHSKENVKNILFRTEHAPFAHLLYDRIPIIINEKENLVKNNGCFYCRKNNADHSARYCPEKRLSKNDQLNVDLEDPEDREESTSEEDSEGYVIDANLVDSDDLKCAIDSQKNCILFNNKINFYEPLFLLSSECEITKTNQAKTYKNENRDTSSHSEAFNLENRVQFRKAKGPKKEIEDYVEYHVYHLY